MPILLLLAGVAGGCSDAGGPAPRAATGALPTSFADQMGCVFTPLERAPHDAIGTQLIDVPKFPGRWALWGSSGRDDRGHLWFGVSAHDIQPPSAHLFEFDPGSSAMLDRGNVVDALEEAGLLRAGEGQMKIHSRIVQGGDGHLYFASFDEQGEHSDGSQLPTWGSHLWRLRLPEHRWEHLLAAPEALLAVAGCGRWIYALGYFNHRLYQFDCQTGGNRSITVGAVGGHTSRNFLCDERGHAYVPRQQRSASGSLYTTLVEFDTDLAERSATLLDHYTQTADENSHGITGVQPLADHSLAFTTDQGFLYRIRPDAAGPAKVEPLGWFHPEGKSYVASLFTADGEGQLLGLSSRETSEGRMLEWLVFDLTAGKSTATPLQLPRVAGQEIPTPLLYGSTTRDNMGRCYLVGVYHQGQDFPLIVRLSERRRD